MANRQIKAENTSMVFGRGFDTLTEAERKDKTNLVKTEDGKIREYLVTSWDHDEDSDLIENQALSPGRGGVPDEINYLWGSGPFSVQVPSENGYLDLIQPLLNDPNPVSVEVPKKPLVAAGTDLAKIDDANYFTDTTDTDIEVVDDQDLADGSKTVSNDLAHYEDGLELEITPDGDAAMSNAEATITITYTDAENDPQTIALVIATGDARKKQTAQLPAGARVTGVVTSGGWNAGKFSITASIPLNVVRNPETNRPGRLRVKYTGELSDHKLLIRGLRRVGLASSDTLPLREEIKLSSDVVTENYFHKINRMIVKDANGNEFTTPKGTVEITAEPDGYETKLKAVNDDPDGLFFEADIGGEPRVVTRGVFISGNIEIGDTIGATFQMLSNRVDKRVTLENRDEEQFKSTMQQDREDHPKDLEARAFERVTERFYSGHGRFLEIDGEAVICNTITLGITHNYDFVPGKVPGMFRRDTDANARRLTTVSVNTNYESGSEEEDTFIRWQEKYRNREKVDVRVVTYQWLGNGRQIAVIYRMRSCDIQSPVRVPANSPGVVPVTVDLKALPLEGQVDGEIEVTIISDDKWIPAP